MVLFFQKKEGSHRLEPVALRHLHRGVHGHLHGVDDWVESVVVVLHNISCMFIQYINANVYTIRRLYLIYNIDSMEIGSPPLPTGDFCARASSL